MMCDWHSYPELNEVIPLVKLCKFSASNGGRTRNPVACVSVTMSMYLQLFESNVGF